MIFRRWFIRMAQHCFVCRKSVWWFQHWFSTDDNCLFHLKCVVRCHCDDCRDLVRQVRESLKEKA